MELESPGLLPIVRLTPLLNEFRQRACRTGRTRETGSGPVSWGIPSEAKVSQFATCLPIMSPTYMRPPVILFSRVTLAFSPLEKRQGAIATPGAFFDCGAGRVVPGRLHSREVGTTTSGGTRHERPISPG